MKSASSGMKRSSSSSSMNRSGSSSSLLEKSFRVGSRVEVSGKDVLGRIAYIGTTTFSSGKWVGVVLDEAKGKNNGTVQGKTYFQCPDDHGIFVRLSQLALVDDESSEGPETSGKTTPATGVSTASTPIADEKKVLRISLSKTPIDDGEKKNISATARDLSTATTPKSGSTSTPASKRASFIETNFVETVTHSYAPVGLMTQGLEEKMANLQRDQENENLRAEIKDLQEKLETLKIKRNQDKEKLKEADKVKIQLQQLLEFKARIMESQNELQKELQKAKQEAKDAIEAREMHADEMSEFTEAIEMATLDKEMAEEKCEALQAEVEQLKEKVEEMTLDLEILRNEMSEKGSEGGASSYQVKQLEQQNERLKEALVKMRDLSAHEKREQQALHKELEQQKSEIAELRRTKEKLSSKLDEYEAQMAELKEQVDAALGAEEMVEQLTERNLSLEEKVAELQDTVNDLEALHDMNEELQENARENELELREEVDISRAKAAEAQKKVEAAHETIADYEQTIQKFRELTENLKERNHDLANQLEKVTNMAVTVPAEMFDFKVKFAETRAHAKAIEMELRKIEVLQANQHVNYLCAFMPDAFLNRGGDHDAVLILLLLPRIVWKAEILLTQLREKYAAPESVNKENVLKSFVVEQYAFACRIAHILLSLQTLLRQYNSALSSCSVEKFIRIGTIYPELAVQEKAIDFYIELLRKDQLDENITLETLEKSLTCFQNIYSQHLSDEKVDCTALMSDTSKLLNVACESIGTEISRLKVLMQDGEENSDTANLLKDLESANEDIRQSSKKIRRRMPQEGAKSPVTFSKEIQSKLFSCSLEIGRVLRSLWEISHSSAPSDPKVALTSLKVKELAHLATDKVYGKDDSGPLECLRHSIDYVKTEMTKIASAMQDGEYDFDGTEEAKSQSPLMLRAQAIKAEVRDVENLKLKLEAKENDLVELKKALKQKMDEFSELHVRKEMVDKKLEVLSKEQDERLEKLQRKLDETTLLLRKKEKEFEETMDHLQADIDALELERGELKEKVKTMSKKALFEGLTKTGGLVSVSSPSSPTQSTPTIQSFASGKDSVLLLKQMQELKVALCHVKNENIRLQADQMKKTLASLPPLKAPKKPTGLVSTTGFVSLRDDSPTGEENPRFVAAYRKSTELVNDIWKFTTGLQVVDITKRRPAAAGQVLDKATPIHHLIDATSQAQQLYQRFDKLQSEVIGLMASQQKGGKVPTDFSEFPPPRFTKMLQEKTYAGPTIGRIVLPARSKEHAGIYSVTVEPDTLRYLHMKLIS